jgi:hypothetical protein
MKLLSLKYLSKTCSNKSRFLTECEVRNGVLMSASARIILSETNPLVSMSVRRIPPQRPWGLLPSSLRQARSPNEFHLNLPQKFVQIRVVEFVQFEALSIILLGEKGKSFKM